MEEKKEQNKIEEIARTNFLLWNDALLTRDFEKVVELYAEDATFLPTMSSEFKKGRSDAKEYFEHFLKKCPISEIVQDDIQSLGSDCYLHSGMYNFEVGSDDNKQTVEARFSFVWKIDQQEGEVWRIIHHHSSIKPKG